MTSLPFSLTMETDSIEANESGKFPRYTGSCNGKIQEKALSNVSTDGADLGKLIGEGSCLERSSMICVKPKRTSKARGSNTSSKGVIFRSATCLQLQ